MLTSAVRLVTTDVRAFQRQVHTPPEQWGNTFQAMSMSKYYFGIVGQIQTITLDSENSGTALASAPVAAAMLPSPSLLDQDTGLD